ncbi:hypothetical protein evm_015077, partial [Chilo suppressalis]
MEDEKLGSHEIEAHKRMQYNKYTHRGNHRQHPNSREAGRRSTRSVSKPRHVEVLLVADRSMTDFHDANNLETYLLTIMNMVSSLYMDPSIGNYIKVVVVKIIFVEEMGAAPDLEVTTNADTTLQSFCRWQQQLNPDSDDNPHHHDVAILITREDICSQHGNPCSGYHAAVVRPMVAAAQPCRVTNLVSPGEDIYSQHDNSCRYGDGALFSCDYFQFYNISMSWSVGLVAVSEPYSIPPQSPNWLADTNEPFSRFQREGYWLCSRLVYLSALEGVVLRAAPLPVLIAGDLNAKSMAWGSTTIDVRGRDLGDWLLSMGLRILNVGNTPTCVRWNGSSVVDSCGGLASGGQGDPPEAVERGLTYGQAIAQARSTVSFGELGIGPAKFRTGITGARIIELPKETSQAQADSLAAKIEEALGDIAKVTRPVKTVDIRVVGIDDSVSAIELAEAIGQLRWVKYTPDHGGLVRHLSRRLEKAKRISVGWSSASVHILEAGPMRCFRCMGTGHPVQRCPSAKDRSGLGSRQRTAQRRSNAPSVQTQKYRQTTAWGGENGLMASVRTAEAKRPTPLPTSLAATTEEPMETNDLMCQSAAEWSVGLVAVSEPYSIPPQSPNWLADTNEPFSRFQREGCWLCSRLVYLSALEGVVLRAAPLPVLIAGDLNAKSTAWGSTTIDVRGRDLGDWLLSMGLRILNVGNTPTCVRWNGSSVVDVTFATPSLASRVVGWRVEDKETLSDHQYIRYGISLTSRGANNTRSPTMSAFPRTGGGGGDGAGMGRCAPHLAGDVDGMAELFADDMKVVCGAAMPRTRTYWWTQEIAELRSTSLRARRAYLSTPDDEAECRRVYKEAKKALRGVLGELHSSPRPGPLGEALQGGAGEILRQRPPTSNLEEELLDRVLGTLFPDPGPFQPPRMLPPGGLSEEPIPHPLPDRLRGKKTAPGPEGVPPKVLALALGPLKERFLAVLNLSIAAGRFPRRWKQGRLVLLRKDGRPEDSPSGYRPIVVLDDAGKFLEKILALRIVEHLEGPGPNLAECQFGFRRNRSTVEAVALLKGWTAVIAVSLDIRNAFNSLPHECIMEALRFHRVPPYLCAIVEDYLQGRVVLYEGPDGRIRSRAMAAGVPQGSVLGPLLWNLGYNWVLRGSLLPGMEVVCFADDTLIAAKAKEVEDVVRLASVGTSMVVRRIHLLGLEVALDKSRAMMFHGPRRSTPPGLHIRVEGVRLPVEGSMNCTRQGPPERGGTRYCVPSTVSRGDTCLKPRTRALLRRPQRVIATRAPRRRLNLDALVMAEMHQVRVETRERGERLAPAELRRVRSIAQSEALRRWDEALAHASAGHRTIEAIRPVLEEWLGRRRGGLTFRMVQILTGHGCFGHYLHRVARREETPQCHHCGAPDDTAEHTLLECPAWRHQRPLSLRSMVEAMLRSDRAWEATASFCENVISQKEAAEREREDDPLAAPSRRRRTGRRGRRRALAAP